MKSTKTILALAVISIFFIGSSSVHAAANTFELYNKADKSIGIMLNNQQQIVPANKQLQLSVNNAQPIYLEIYPNTANLQELRMNLMGSDVRKFRIDAQGKTVYLSWSPSKSPSLYPQTGPLMGLMGKTESGLSLSNNVKSTDIKQ